MIYDMIGYHCHQENILSETVNEMGVAKVGPYWVQVFGKRRENK